MVNKIRVEIKVALSKNAPDNSHHWVDSGKFRDEIQNSSINIKKAMFLTTEDNFFEEVGSIIKGLEGKPFNNEAIEEAVISFCDSELRKFGKLIDVDIEGYLDDIMHILVALSKALRMKPITEKEGVKLRNDYKEFIYQSYFNHIYVQGPAEWNSERLAWIPKLIKFNEL